MNKKKKTILYVDDCVNQLNLMRDNLEDFGVKCYTANNGLEGYKTYLNKKDVIDVILTDIKMPYWDGFDLLNHIRLMEQIEKLPRKKVISLSGNFEESAYYVGLGFDKHLTKPAKIEDILEQIYKK